MEGILCFGIETQFLRVQDRGVIEKPLNEVVDPFDPGGRARSFSWIGHALLFADEPDGAKFICQLGAPFNDGKQGAIIVLNPNRELGAFDRGGKAKTILIRSR